MHIPLNSFCDNVSYKFSIKKNHKGRSLSTEESYSKMVSDAHGYLDGVLETQSLEEFAVVLIDGRSKKEKNQVKQEWQRKQDHLE